MTTSAVVLSYRPGDWLAGALRSVAGQADEVVLVDNGSDGAGASRIGRDLGAVVVRSETNLGYAAGVNLGVRRASGDVLALLNDDAVAGPGWIAAAAAALAAPDVAAVTPKILLSGWYQELRLDGRDGPAAGREPEPARRRLSSVLVEGRDSLGGLRGPGAGDLEAAGSSRWRWTVPGGAVFVPVPGAGAEVVVNGERVAGEACRLVNKAGSLLRADGTLGDVGEGEADDGSWDRPGERFFASGTAVALRADTFARIGGLAEPFFAYYEDADWCWRARLAGMRILYDPAVVVEHRHSATSGGTASLALRRRGANNYALTLVRNAPRSVAAGVVRRRLRGPDPDRIRRSLVARLPWGVRTRRALSAGWELTPNEVWDRWAGRPDGEDRPTRTPR